MNTTNVIRWHHLTGAVLCLCAAQMGWAQDAAGVAQPGDPVRWYQQDSTSHDYFLTLKKEAEAVYQEAQTTCQSLNGTSRRACLKEAQAQFRQDMSDAKLKDKNE